MKDAMIMEEVERLAKTFPLEEVRLEIQFTPDKPIRWCASMNTRAELPFVAKFAETATLAVDSLIASVSGERDMAKAKAERIAKMRKELAELERTQTRE